ncbi:ABC transporter permease [Desulfatiglans anilini]|uniref:ABC transporter permease n=1 Tax=Desulfatiglans anilini TaxID=90728 RepID=UPI0004069026|nr:iron export ABC transporter permease subunit FetB [Desulfatiglans anilini]
MTAAVPDISLFQLALGCVFILGAGAVSFLHGLGLERDLLLGAVRTFAQLFLLGYVLKFVFNAQDIWLVTAVFVFMILFAAWTIRARAREKQIALFWPTFLSMLFSYWIISYLVSGVVVGATPWWRAQVFIPLGGMVIGNSMNAVAVSLERLLSDLRGRRREVEMMLCLGADYREASREILRNAIKAGMIPSINSMMAAGVVFIPGMMTGQILAGADPLTAIRYQIVVMLMIVGSTAIGAFLVLMLVRRLCFGAAQQLLLRPKGG